MGATLLPPAADNPRGFFEDAEVVRLNDRLLAAEGMPGSWDSLLLREDGPPQQNHLDELLPEAVSIVRSEYGDSPLIGMKDPRLCHLLPFWSRAATLAGYTPSVVFIYRHPLEVAASLGTRGGTEEVPGVLLWARHVLDWEIDSRALPRCIVSYDRLLSDPLATVASIQSSLAVTFPSDSHGTGDAIRGFLSQDLRHHSRAGRQMDGYPESIVRLASLMKDLACGLRQDDEETRAEMDRIRREQEFWLRPICAGYWREMRAREELSKEVADIREEVARIRASRTFVAAQWAAAPYRGLRQLVRKLGGRTA